MQMQMVLKEQQQQARQKRQRYQTFGKGKVVNLRASPRSQQRRSQRQHQPLQQQSPQIQTALPKWLYTDENPGFAAQLSNVLINEAFLVAVLALTAYAVFTVDSEAWRGWYPNEILYRVPIDNWRSYETAVVADPVPIKAAITGVTYLIGDWLAQANSLSKEGKSWLDADRPRLFRSTVVGLFLLGPLAHFYYDFVGTLDTWPIVGKIALDQTAYLAFYNTVYYVSLTVLAGKSFGEAVEEYKDSFWLLLTSGWKLWPLVGIVTYTLIPQQNRVLWIDGIEIIYSALLSSLANKEGENSGY